MWTYVHREFYDHIWAVYQCVELIIPVFMMIKLKYVYRSVSEDVLISCMSVNIDWLNTPGPGGGGGALLCRNNGVLVELLRSQNL